MVLLILSLVACAPTPSPAPWPGADERPALTHSWFETAALPELSLYVQHVAGDARPTAAYRGPLAVGNGRVFAMMGLTDPLNTVHGAMGPTYRKDARFFVDVAMTLRVDGEPVAFDEEWMARPRGTGLVVTRADAGELTLYTVDAALYDGGPLPVIGRWLLVSSRSAVAHEVSLDLVSPRSLTDVAGMPADVVGDRILAVAPWGTPVVDRQVVLGEVAAGGEASGAVALVTSQGTDALQATVAALPTPEVALAEALRTWSTWSARGVSVSTDDPRVADLYDGLRVTLKTQQSEFGGVSPMSRYAGVWLRDTIGPVRFFTRAGLPDEALAALEYMHGCHVVRGDYGNACPSGLTPDDWQALPEPDWATMGPLSGRTAAEGPSYLPLAAATYARWSGDETFVHDRWDYVRRGVMAQQMGDGGEQPFAGDETFRAAMSLAMGFPLEYDWQGLAWSANSAFLMAAAADLLVPYAPQEDVAGLQRRGALARQALDEVFWQDGYWAPYVFHTEGDDNAAGDVAAAPFEDVNLKATWLGAMAADDVRVSQDLDALVASAGAGPGLFQSPPTTDPPIETDLDLSEGFSTGMLPGYALWALVATGDPAQDAAFDALNLYAGPTGEYPEDVVVADHAALQLVYDSGGTLGDYVSRYRPWEGAINADAMLWYLAGAEPIAGGLSLAPHLPRGATTMTLSQVTVPAGVVDLTVSRDGGDLVIRVVSRAPSGLVVALEVPLPAGVSEPRVDAPVATSRRVLPRGEERVVLAPVSLAPGGELEVRVTGAGRLAPPLGG